MSDFGSNYFIWKWHWRRETSWDKSKLSGISCCVSPSPHSNHTRTYVNAKCNPLIPSFAARSPNWQNDWPNEKCNTKPSQCQCEYTINFQKQKPSNSFILSECQWIADGTVHQHLEHNQIVAHSCGRCQTDAPNIDRCRTGQTAAKGRQAYSRGHNSRKQDQTEAGAQRRWNCGCFAAGQIQTSKGKTHLASPSLRSALINRSLPIRSLVRQRHL